MLRPGARSSPPSSPPLPGFPTPFVRSEADEVGVRCLRFSPGWVRPTVGSLRPRSRRPSPLPPLPGSAPIDAPGAGSRGGEDEEEEPTLSPPLSSYSPLQAVELEQAEDPGTLDPEPVQVQVQEVPKQSALSLEELQLTLLRMWVEGHDTCISLGLMFCVVLISGMARVLVRKYVHSTFVRIFTAELLSTFQQCCCSHELQVLSDLRPADPSWTLTIVYFFSLVHGLTLVGAVSNPCGVLEQLALEQMPLWLGFLKICAQFLSSGLSRTFMIWIWSLGVSKRHFVQRALKCSDPIHIALPEAFLVEMLCSFIFHSAMMHFQDVRLKFRIHMQAALITFLVFSGGNLTGAVFNPALALSLHLQCFHELFFNYLIVYCLAPSLGIMLMVLMFIHFLPWLHNMNRIKKNE